MAYPLRIAEQLRVHLKTLRQEQGLTQTQLGDRLGLKQARIAEIEAAPGVVSVEQLIRILAALGASLELSDRRGAPVERPPVQPKARRSAANQVIPSKKGSW